LVEFIITLIINNMDFKDFKKIIKQKTKSAFSLLQSTYVAKQRQSRPRVKKDIIRDVW